MSSRSGLVTSIVIVIIVFGSVGGLLFLTNQYDPSRVAMVTMNPGWGEMSRADQVQDGLEAESLSVLYEWIPAPQTEAEAETLILNLAASGNYLLIVALGEELADAVEEAAAAHPNQKFCLIGAEVIAPNVATATFAMEEGAFLAGAAAAFVATNDPGRLIGILGTKPTDAAVNRLIAGFQQGVVAANTTYDLRVHFHDEIRWVQSFNDSQTAYEEAMNFFTVINTSIIFAPVRASYPGIRQAMIEANVSLVEGYTFRDPYVIAAENHLDRYGLPDLSINSGRTWMTTSVTATYDAAVFNILNQTLWNEFTPGNVHFNLQNGGVNITEFRWSSIYVTPARIADVFAYQELIINGTIVITVP